MTPAQLDRAEQYAYGCRGHNQDFAVAYLRWLIRGGIRPIPADFNASPTVGATIVATLDQITGREPAP